MADTVQTALKNLQKNHMQAVYLPTKGAVVPTVAGWMQENQTVAVSGSATLFETGVIEHLRSGRYQFWDRHAPGLTEEEIHAVHHRAFMADTYLCGVNAITQNGELYNVDGNANRIAALVYGPKSVIVVAGINKLVENLQQAALRVKTKAAPAICQMRGRATYCATAGRCLCTDVTKHPVTAGCASPARTCCNYLVCGPQRVSGRIKVILVGEPLGL